MPLAILPFLLLVIPITEIAVFILVGQWIGLWWTLAGILVTAIAGTILLRREGLRVLARIREETARGAVPGRALGEGAMLLVAGILLLTPGFVTDTIGFLLFVPGVRGTIWRVLAARLADAVVLRTAGMGGGMGANTGSHHAGFGPPSRSGQTGIVDLDADEFEDLTPDPRSPWRGGDTGPRGTD